MTCKDPENAPTLATLPARCNAGPGLRARVVTLPGSDLERVVDEQLAELGHGPPVAEAAPAQGEHCRVVHELFAGGEGEVVEPREDFTS